MPTPIRAGLLFIFAFALCSLAAARQDQPDWMREGHRARLMAMAFHSYAQEHDDRVPPDMATLAVYLTGDLSKATPAQRSEAIRRTMLSQQDQGLTIPDTADERWAAEHSSYAYIAGGDFRLSDLGDWQNLVVMHLKLDRGAPGEPTPDNPDGRTFAVAFLDSHVEMMGRAEAERVIAESRAVFDALRSGRPLPDEQQIPMDLKVIVRAIRAYAKANGGSLPPDLGSTLEHIAPDSKRLATPKLRGAVYLSPDARRNTHIPDEPTAEWVNDHASYSYLGAAGIQLASVEDPGNTVIIHGKLDSPIEFKTRAGPQRGIGLGLIGGGAAIQEDEYSRWIVDVSRRVLAFARTGSPLPDHVNALRDARIIGQAIADFAKDHQGQLPPDLGAVVPYAMPHAPAADRAAIFLSPKGERSTTVPESLSPEWVNRFTSYTYLGVGGIDLKLAREAGVQVLFHGPLSEAYEIRIPGGQMTVIASGTAYAYPWLTPVEHAERTAKESRETLDALRAAK